jgi:acyl-CoA thioester hydrolase
MERPVYHHSSRIAFADADASGKLHFTKVFRHVEEAEHAFLHSRGVPVFDRFAGFWARVQVWCDYLRPLACGEQIGVVLKMARLGSSSITWEFEITNTAGETAASGSMTTVRVDPEGNARPIEPAERAALTSPVPS